MKVCLMLILVFFFFFSTYAQKEKPVRYAPKREQRELLDSLCNLIMRHHVNQDEAKKITLKLQDKFEKRSYAPYVLNRIEFIEALSFDLQQLSFNKSFRLIYTANNTYIASGYPTFKFVLPIPRQEREGTLMFEYPISFLTPADYAIYPLGRVPDYLYGKDFQEKMNEEMYSHGLQLFGVEIDKLDLKIDKKEENLARKNFQKENIVSKKWLRKQRLFDWRGLYLLPYKQWGFETFDVEKHRPHEYLQKKGKKTLAAKMIELKQRFRNYGFSEIKTLEGGISYLRISAWAERQYTDKHFLHNIMSRLSESQAVIFDLKACGEGSLSLLPEFCAYFLNKKQSVKIAALNGEEIKTSRKLKRKSPRLLKQKIYVLTDSGTSGASDVFISFLKKNTNAKIVGTHGSGKPYIFHRFPLEKNRIYAEIPIAEIQLPEENLPSIDIQETSEDALAAAKQDFFMQKYKETTNDLSLFCYKYWADIEIARKNIASVPADSLKKYQQKYPYDKKVVFENEALFLVERAEKRRLFPLNGVWLVENTTELTLNPTDYAHPVAGMQVRIAYINFVFNAKSGLYDAEVIYTNGEKSLLKAR